MARPKKHTVDYFPHFCDHGQTMFILEQKYGNDGYAFWFKILELLGKTERHFLNCNNPATWLYILSLTRIDSEKAMEILKLLGDLEAIDGNLWESKIIWSDNFIKGIADVYRNRRVEIPTKPSIYTAKQNYQEVSTPQNTQSKVKESKVNKTREKLGASPPPGGGNGDARPATPIYSCESFEISQEYFQEIATKYPLLPKDYLLKEFFPNMRDWCLDNRQKPKYRPRFDSQGRLKNPRSCFRNWLAREDPAKIDRVKYDSGPDYPLATPIRPREGDLAPKPDCKDCGGRGIRKPPGESKYEPCHCLTPVEVEA